jgi:hypothetical protein
MGKENAKLLSAWLDEFYQDTGTLSGIVRNIALGGIGIIWIFKSPDLMHHVLPKELLAPLKFIILGILGDVMQYIWRSINIYLFWKIKDVKHHRGQLTGKQIQDVTMPEYISIGTWVFFIAKIACVSYAYYLLYLYLLAKF